MNELEAMKQTAEIAARIEAKPRPYLEAVEQAARRLVQAKRRTDELDARRELSRLLSK